MLFMTSNQYLYWQQYKETYQYCMANCKAFYPHSRWHM